MRKKDAIDGLRVSRMRRERDKAQADLSALQRENAILRAAIRELGAAVRLAEETIANTLRARGYKPATNEWAPEVKKEVATLGVVRDTLRRAKGG